MTTMTAADIQDELWLEVARYHPGAAAKARALQVAAPPPPTLPLHPLTLPALLTLDGAPFIEAAYRAILGRAPDDAGAAYFMREMAAGTNKIVLLGQLQRSREGKRARRLLPGLRSRYLAHRLYGLPALGGVARLAGAASRRTGLSRSLIGDGPAGGRRAEQEALLSRLVAALEIAEQRLTTQDTAIEAAARRIAELQAAQQEAARAVRPQIQDAALKSRLGVQEDEQRRMQASLAKQAASVLELAAAARRAEQRLDGVEDSSIEAMLAMSDTLADHAARLAPLEGKLNGEAVAAQIDAGADALRRSLDQRLCRAEATVAQNREVVIDQERRIGLMLEAVRRLPVTSPPELQAQDERAVEGLYVDFEDRFRGTRADIKQRLRFYLPILREAGAGTATRPVVDVGCGRGEFLELLREDGLTARGVDSNAAMVAACHGLGLDGAAEDALDYLGRQPAGSLGAVTGFHIVEHLPYKTMVRLMDAALHALAPGGIMVFETPNPANLLVASRWFYLDPTHRNPLPGEMLAMIAEARGFARVSIVELHPMAQRFGGNDSVLRDQLDALFYGPQDYALLARKP